MSMDLKLNDPVKVAQKNDNPLQGVVAYLGPLEFAEGDDWVGVRLTGDSVGKGKNDGSVQGKVYFSTSHEKGGVFVRRANVSPWVLSKLEELRLKREIQGILPTVVSRSPSMKTISTKDDDESSVSSMKSSATGMSGKSRLEEIRAKRMALQQQQKSHVNVSSSPAPKNTSEFKTLPKTYSSSPFRKDDMNDSRNVSSNHSKTESNMRGDATPPKEGTVQTPGSKRNSPMTNSKKVFSSQEDEINSQSSEFEKLKESMLEMSKRLEEKDEIQKFNSQEIHRLTEELQMLRCELDLKAKQNEALQSSLKLSQDICSKAQRDYEEAKLATIRAEKEIDDWAKENSKEKAREDLDSSAYLDEIKLLRKKLEEAQNEKESHAKGASLLEERLDGIIKQNASLQAMQDKEKEEHEKELYVLQQDLSNAKLEITSLKRKLSQKEDKVTVQEQKGISQYKERATIQAEMASLQRRLQETEKEKQDLEKAVEDLVLDKDALQEKLEALEDKYEEMKIDAESAQIEVDELKLELDDANAYRERAEAKVVLSSAFYEAKERGDNNDETEDAAQVLSVQNARLREAILRLREQSNAEKIDLTKQIRSMERDIEEAKNAVEELKELRKKETIMKEEIRELKEMVDQGAAFEEMVEQMSARVIVVEENNISLQNMIRELEEASELNAEIEETQAEEIKALTLDLQSRDATIANFEEAIKIQRRRELDYQRTTINYKALVDSLQQERDSLLSEIGTRDGIQNDAVLSSQKALAQAVQSISDAADARIKEAESSFHLIDATVKSHLAERLEDFLPEDVSSSEIKAVKGELLLSKVAMKASLTLINISEMFEKSINWTRNRLSDPTILNRNNSNIKMTFNLCQKIASLVHETKFSQSAIDVFETSINLLIIGQFPGVISAKSSVALGCFVSHAVLPLDTSISSILSILKKEGGLSPHQANINLLTQPLAKLRLALHDCIDDDGKQIVPSEWSFPCIDAFKALSSSKFLCYGATSILCSIVMDETTGLEHVSDSLIGLVFKMERNCKEIKSLYCSISAFDITDTTSVAELYEVALSSKSCFQDLFDEVESACKNDEISIESIGSILSYVDTAAGYLVKLNSFIRAKKITIMDENHYVHQLSPESQNPWLGVINEAKKISGAHSGVDHLNYIFRGREIRKKLTVALENDTKLMNANEKIAILEKNLLTRMKEISIQNSRLEELENLISLSDQSLHIVASPARTPKSTEEVETLKDELKTLTETIDVLQSQVSEYEKEIRSFKDSKTKSTRKKGASDFLPVELGSPHSKNSSQEMISTSRNALYLETSLFRPALRDALSEASMWKAKAVREKLASLPSLKELESSSFSNERKELALARADYRRARMSNNIFSLRDLSNERKALMDIMTSHRLNTITAIKRCEHISSSLKFSMNSNYVVSI